MKRPQRRIASIVFFNYGDSKFITLFQEMTHLKLAMQEYDFKVLLKDDSRIDLVEGDETIANIKEAPTRDNLHRYLNQLSNDGYIIDLWIFAHGNQSGFGASNCNNWDECWISEDDIRNFAPNGKTLSIRLVYQINCYGSYLNNAWRAIGADTAIGARYVNFYPTQFDSFARNWNRGKTVSYSLDKANSVHTRTLVQGYILVDSVASRGQWGGCDRGKTVLSRSECARRYFEWAWFVDDSNEWQNNLSGKKNMNYSSIKIVSGNQNLTIGQ
jgi:hypothetical protein